MGDSATSVAPETYHGSGSSSNSKRNFPFTMAMLMDRKTEAYVKFAKVFIIFQDEDKRKRSACIAELVNRFKQACCVCSEPKAKNSQSMIYEDAKDACQKGMNLIIVDAVSTIEKYVGKLIYLAANTNYVLLFEPPFVVKEFPRKKSKFQRFSYVPLSLAHHVSFGWYLNEKDSLTLREEACLYMTDCVDEIPQFLEKFEKCGMTTDLLSFFGLNSNPKTQDLVTCVTKLCHHNAMMAYRFLEKHHTVTVYGRKNALHITGFIISPCVIAARLKLTFKQRELWYLDDKQDPESKSSMLPVRYQKVPGEFEEAFTITSKCRCTVIRSGADSLYDPMDVGRGRGCSAHFILGKSASAKPQNIRWDVSDAVSREDHVMTHGIDDVDTYDIGKAIVKRFGRFWIIYLKDSLTVDAMFASHCVAKNP